MLYQGAAKELSIGIVAFRFKTDSLHATEITYSQILVICYYIWVKVQNDMSALKHILI